MKKFILLSLFLSMSVLATSEKESLWAIKVNMWLHKSTIYDLQKTIYKDLDTSAKECYQIGIISEGYQLKRAYTNVNQLRKVNAPLASYLYKILFQYVEKRGRKLKGYCFESDDSTFEVGNREALLKETKEIVLDIEKLEFIIQERVDELEQQD